MANGVYMKGKKYSTAKELGWKTATPLLRLYQLGLAERPIRNAARQWAFVDPNIEPFDVMNDLKTVRAAKTFVVHYKRSVLPCRTKAEVEKVVRGFGENATLEVQMFTGRRAYVVVFRLGWNAKKKSFRWVFSERLAPAEDPLSALTPASQQG